ncbi:MAG TPA: hypothetical protein VJ767_06160 [Nitrososphaeraceae archaeon]|nr:hypothetical protein [Nitrososphaeraceae archaeon]
MVSILQSKLVILKNSSGRAQLAYKHARNAFFCIFGAASNNIFISSSSKNAAIEFF